MTGKRALIVDDSKSARAFLAKILEKHELLVDSAESAEQAIDYLADHRPDVIFMDHLMPGMDGFQAVQAIKNNPRTAMIPIMMYTSQEGELYLGQARALGAVGVLPKQIKPADVQKVLYQLHLAPERRSGDQTSFRPYIGDGAETSVEEIAEIPAAPIAHPLTDITLREQLTELRRALMVGLDSQSERVAADVRSMLLEGLPQSRGSGVLPWLVALLSLIVAIASVALWRQEARRSRVLATEIAAVHDIQTRESSAVPAATDAASATAASRAPAPAPIEPIVAPVPYGEDVFAGARLDLIRQVFRRLEGQSFRGTVDIASFPGRFCLVGTAAEGYSVAPDETPVSRCDLVGNPYDDSQQGARQPLALANLIGDFRHATKGAADVRLSTGDPAGVVNTYPTVGASTSAGDWNRAAAANNRIEIRVQH